MPPVQKEEQYKYEPELSFEVNFAGSSFSSFVNPVETVEDEDMYDIVFQNNSLSSIAPMVPNFVDEALNEED